MSNVRFNPTLNTSKAAKRSQYGYVVRVPSRTLLPPRAGLKNVTLFDESDECFYTCVLAGDEYQWRAVTFGASRPFLIPVGKLATYDYDTSKRTVADLSQTINEIIMGLRRYGVELAPLGFALTSDTTFTQGHVYYRWNDFDDIEGIENWLVVRGYTETSDEYYRGYKKYFKKRTGSDIYDEITGWGVGDEVQPVSETGYDSTVYECAYGRNYTGEFKLLTTGVDYQNGDPIPDKVIFQAVPEPSYTDLGRKINELVTQCNEHGASIPRTTVPSIDPSDAEVEELCDTVNLVIDEVNPFAAGWQLILNRVWNVEEAHDDLENGVGHYKALTRWDDADWAFLFSTDGETVKKFSFGTVAASVDNILQLMKKVNDVHGKLFTVLNGQTLAQFLSALSATVAEHTSQITALQESDVVHTTGLDQLRQSLGNCGFILATGNYVAGQTYYTWDGDKKIFVRKTDWSAGQPIPSGTVYKFDSNESARALIDSHKAHFDALVGTQLEDIYVECLETGNINVTANEYYYLGYEDPEDPEEGETEAFWRISHNPGVVDADVLRGLYTKIFVKCSDTTVVDQIVSNNKEIARVNREAKIARDTILSNVRKLKTLTGVAGAAGLPDEWNIDGYEPVAEGTFQDHQRYYKLVGENYVELVPGTAEQVEGGTADYVVGDDVTSYEFTTYVRKVSNKEQNTHRGLIDRNTDDIQKDRTWARTQMDLIKKFVMDMTLTTIAQVTQEECSWAVLHDVIDKLITIHNAFERLTGQRHWKCAMGNYESGYDYYRLVKVEDHPELSWTECEPDEEAVAYGLYYTKVGDNYVRIYPDAGTVLPAGTYKPIIDEEAPMVEGEDYEIGLEVGEHTYTKDLVVPNATDYTMEDLRIAVNRMLDYHITSGELPNYTKLSGDTIIVAGIKYYRWVNDMWDEIDPEADDPSMIGQAIEVYDPTHPWYLKTERPLPDTGCTMTMVRMYFNEMTKLHRRGSMSLGWMGSLDSLSI